MSTWNGKIILKMEIKYRIGNEVTDRARVQLGFVPIFHFSVPQARSLLSAPRFPFRVLVTSPCYPFYPDAPFIIDCFLICCPRD